ncbi:MAG: hypothetical protein ACE5FK_02365, partial [Candidatus Methylomirabilia bacterium]
MMHRFRQYLDERRLGVPTLAAVALSFLLVGLAVASELHGTGASETREGGNGARASMAASATPNSFADLAKELGPTVVNIKVTKVEQV